MRRIVIACFAAVLSFQAQAASLGGIASELRSKCGAKVIAGTVNRNVAGTNMRSCHAMGQAIDVTGNYACIYKVLKKWPGGYTTDPGRCKHVHISSCKREWGLRFRHHSC